MASTEQSAAKPSEAHPIQWATRAVLFVDIVEFVRLIDQDEEGVISRWLDLIKHIETQILQSIEGRLVKRIGDGLLLEFGDVRSAMSTAFAIQRACEHDNAGLPTDRQILLRMGIEVGDVIVERDDVYGRDVNLAARLMTLAGPGQIVISARAREFCTPDIDADIEDLGDCYLKHIRRPVRAFRISPLGSRRHLAPWMPLDDLLPAIAVIPFAAHDVAPDLHVLGEVLAEEITRELSRSPDLNVISRLSTTIFRDRAISIAEIGAHLSVDYVLSGIYRVNDHEIELDAELAEAESGQITWTGRFKDNVRGFLDGERDLIGNVIAGATGAMMSRELHRTQTHALPTLKSYSLLMGSIAFMHRLSRRDFERAHHLLQTLVDRAPRQSVPQAWLAKWHVLRVQQGWSSDPQRDGQLALGYTKQALDTDPDSSLALAIDGFVHTNLLKRLDIAQQRYDLAIQTNPNDSLAWLLKGTLHAFMGEGRPAVESTRRALMLSPFDPHRYFYDSLAATAHLAARQYDQALTLAQRSYRANRTHTSTLRAIAIAQWELGLHDAARNTAQELMNLEPGLTVENWLGRSPSAPYYTGREWANVLKQVGVPH